ncbi:MAG: sulfide/dihydroorotate dehydrogenase-like FAD/NAD-binding protein [Nocardioides sp.]
MAARPGQFVRLLAAPDGELIPLTLADWDTDAGTVDLVVQAMGTSSIEINAMAAGEAFTGIAGPLGQPSRIASYDDGETVVFAAGGLGLPPVFPIMREHLRRGNHVTLIAGFRSADLLFWTGPGERVPRLQEEFGDRLEVIYTSNDGSFGREGFVTVPLEELLEANRRGEGRRVAEVVAIGPPLMMRAVSELTAPYGVTTVASLNSIMVDATGMCGACMVPVVIDGKLVRRHACIDGPEIDAHLIDWDKFLPKVRPVPRPGARLDGPPRLRLIDEVGFLSREVGVSVARGGSSAYTAQPAPRHRCSRPQPRKAAASAALATTKGWPLSATSASTGYTPDSTPQGEDGAVLAPASRAGMNVAQITAASAPNSPRSSHSAALSTVSSRTASRKASTRTGASRSATSRWRVSNLVRHVGARAGSASDTAGCSRSNNRDSASTDGDSRDRSREHYTPGV